MRPKQWTKNVFLLAALVFDRQLTNVDSLISTAIGLILFTLLISTVYIFNDVSDIEADRQHPKKKNRPIAAGKVPVRSAIMAAVFILIITIPLSFWLSSGFGIISVAYFLMQLAYTKWIKHIPLLDVLTIAAGFVLRVAAGVAIIQVERFSPWMYVVTTLFALYIGFGKRRAELVTLAENADSHRRVLKGYNIPFLDQLITIVSSTTIIAYSLYTFSAPNLPDNHITMLTIPFVLYGIFRWLYLMQVKGEGGAPEELILSDRPLQVVVMLYGITVLIIFYLF
jgi:4-hydroxybenzoate polyprenyltransferase